MPSKKLCTNLAQEKQAFYCLLKHAVIPRGYVERVCKGGESLTEACIKAYEIERLKKRFYIENSTIQPTLERPKTTEENATIDKLITVENMDSEALNTEDISVVLDKKDLDFHEELLANIPKGKAQLKKMTKPPPPPPPPPPTRPKLSPPPPPSETTIVKAKNYPEKAKDYESMAQKMRDSELYSEAAIDICASVLAWILAGEIPRAIQSLKNFVDTLDAHMKEQVTSHPAFLLSRALITAVYHKDHGKFYEAEVYARDLYSKLQYGEDKAFIAEGMKKIEELLKNQW
ncbi:MAG: hypothetical protein ACFFCD_07280 [Promethearchaeota archaeon]